MSEGAFDHTRWRPASFLPEQDARDPALLFVVAVLCFLACLTALGVIAAIHWEALKLWLKGVRLHPAPSRPNPA